MRLRQRALKMKTQSFGKRKYDAAPFGVMWLHEVKRRDMSKGQKAMIVAQARLFATNKTQTQGATVAGVQQSCIAKAEAIIKFAPEMAEGVAKGSASPDEAYDEARRRKSAVSAKDVQMARLRGEAPDLAELIKQEKMRLSEALAALDQRIVDERNAQRSTTRALNNVLTALETGEGRRRRRRTPGFATSISAWNLTRCRSPRGGSGPRWNSSPS